MTDHAKQNAAAWMESIADMMARMDAAREGAMIECGQCEGSGTTQSASNGDEEECPVCGGTGEVENPHNEESVREEIEESPLSVSVRSGWYSPGAKEDATPEEFEILLSTGGPALRIIGRLDEHCQPSEPRLQYQDWGTPWTDYHGGTEAQDNALEAFCGVFWFGE